MEITNKLAALEALLFAAGEPLPVPQLAALMGLTKPMVWELLTQLEEEYKNSQRGLCLRSVAGGYQLSTKADFYELVQCLVKTRELKLTNAALEALAIVALHQPVTRAEIENIRGVKTDRVIATLLDLHLIEERGRKKALGNPVLFGTTQDFLQVFGLSSLDQLPQIPKAEALTAAELTEIEDK